LCRYFAFGCFFDAFFLKSDLASRFHFHFHHLSLEKRKEAAPEIAADDNTGLRDGSIGLHCRNTVGADTCLHLAPPSIGVGSDFVGTLAACTACASNVDADDIADTFVATAQDSAVAGALAALAAAGPSFLVPHNQSKRPKKHTLTK